METIGARIKLAREHHGLRGIEVTRKLGWKRQATIFDLEASSGGISTKHLASLAELLGVSIDWLVTGKPEHAPAWLSATDPPAEPTDTKPEAAA
jgi:transcriptional regulator with XRE-family HTH domain